MEDNWFYMFIGCAITLVLCAFVAIAYSEGYNSGEANQKQVCDVEYDKER